MGNFTFRRIRLSITVGFSLETRTTASVWRPSFQCRVGALSHNNKQFLDTSKVSQGTGREDWGILAYNVASLHIEQYDDRWTYIILKCMLKTFACMLSHFSHVRLLNTPWTVAHQASLSMEVLQARKRVSCHFLL